MAKTYKPVPADKPPPPSTAVPAPAISSLHAKKGCVNFKTRLNYGHPVGQGPDALEEYLSTPPLPEEMVPIGYWLKKWKGEETMANPAAAALAQMAGP
jgi:hypothetical protein